MIKLSGIGQQMLSNPLRVFSTSTETLVVCKLLQAEGPMDLSEIKTVLVGTQVEGREWTPTLVENVVARLKHLSIVEEKK